jgi:hypothetical protein
MDINNPNTIMTVSVLPLVCMMIWLIAKPVVQKITGKKPEPPKPPPLPPPLKKSFFEKVKEKAIEVDDQFHKGLAKVVEQVEKDWQKQREKDKARERVERAPPSRKPNEAELPDEHKDDPYSWM